MKVLQMPDWRLVLTLFGSGLLIAAASAAEPSPRSRSASIPGLVQYQSPEGITYSAIVLPAPPAPAKSAVPHDHVIVIDTSASQTGEYRARAIAMSTAVCRALPAGDRVQLLAADVTTARLSDEFDTVGSPKLEAAFAKLDDRVPLGSTNMELALRTALKSFSGTRARSVLYVGDGFSTAQLIDSPNMKNLLADLRSAAVPVNSFAVGPRTELLLLGTLAQLTGGVVVIDEQHLVADSKGLPGDLSAVSKDLARAAVAPVFYPTTIETTPHIPSVLPQMLPPVRFDRETILLGKDLLANRVQVRLTGTLNGETRNLAWDL